MSWQVLAAQSSLRFARTTVDDGEATVYRVSSAKLCMILDLPIDNFI